MHVLWYPNTLTPLYPHTLGPLYPYTLTLPYTLTPLYALPLYPWTLIPLHPYILAVRRKTKKQTRCGETNKGDATRDGRTSARSDHKWARSRIHGQTHNWQRSTQNKTYTARDAKGSTQEHIEFHTLKQETRERGTSSSVKQAGIGMSTGIVSSISKQQTTENASHIDTTNKTVVAHAPPEQKQTKNKGMPLHPYTSSYSNTLSFSYRYTLIPLHPYSPAAGHGTNKWNSRQDNA